MKLMFVVNPISGGVNKEPFLRKAKSYCKTYGIDYSIFKTTGKDDDAHLQKELKNYQPDRVVSVGGDGTTLFTAINLLNTKYPMGIVPLGSANGMATELFVPNNPMDALNEIVVSQIIEGLDLVQVNKEHYTLHIGDVGINAGIVHAYEQDSNRGMATYAKYFFEELRKQEPFDMTIETSHTNIETSGLMLGICNARKYGTGVPLNISGNPMDGKFELVIIKDVKPQTLIKSGLSKFDERFFDSKGSELITTDYANVSFKAPRLLQLDGEVIGKFKHLEIEMLSNAVQLITSKNNKNILS